MNNEIELITALDTFFNEAYTASYPSDVQAIVNIVSAVKAALEATEQNTVAFDFSDDYGPATINCFGNGSCELLLRDFDSRPISVRKVGAKLVVFKTLHVGPIVEQILNETFEKYRGIAIPEPGAFLASPATVTGLGSTRVQISCQDFTINTDVFELALTVLSDGILAKVTKDIVIDGLKFKVVVSLVPRKE